jgi:PAS domain S-box-containing protein
MSIRDEAARRLAAIIESSDDAIISKDLNGIVVSWNPAAERMFGYTSDEMIGQSIRKIIPIDRDAEEDHVLGQIRQGRRLEHFETIRQRKNGELIPISLTVSPVHNAEGQVIGASKIARDISESMRLRDAAREQAEISSRLAEIGSVVAATLDRNLIAQKVTDAATEFTHAEFGAFFHTVNDPNTGQAFMLHALSGAPKEAFAHFPNPRTTAIFGPTFRGGGPIRLHDVTLDPRFGQNAPYHGLPPGHLPVRSYLAVPVVAASGDVLGGLFFGHSRPGVFTDQDQQLAVGIAAWASVALQNAELFKEAQEANRMKDEFLAVLSHELRTPLNSILGYARLIQSGVITGEKVKRGMEVLERNAGVLTQIVEDVLDVSRIITGKMRIEVQPVDLATVVHNAVATVTPAADAKGVRIETTIASDLQPVSGDADKLQQVAWNLLTNAVKFTPRGGHIDVMVRCINAHMEIVVTDTGIGMRPEFLPYVFERFRQADSGTTRKTGGLGLGLAIARHIVEMHGGTVHVGSEGEGRGSTFRVALPLMPQARSMELVPDRPSPLHRPAAQFTDLKGIRVLAIDDEADALMFLRVALEAAGADVTVLPTAVGAIERLEAIQPHVLVIDLAMPGMDGFEFISRVRASSNPAIRAIPAAALTAYARSEDRTRALRSGFELHLAKPIDPAELVASVATLARRHASLRHT